MRWLSPPDKRELLLVLFSLTVFILAYNLEYEHTLRSLGWHMDSEDSSALIGYYGSYLGLSPKGGDIAYVASDGRKRPPWRDKWEGRIFGEWPWFEGHVAEEDKDGKSGRGKHGGMWSGQKEISSEESLGTALWEDRMADGFSRWWEEDIPHTRVLKHVPGYTILDNIFLHNLTLYLVSDDFDSLPLLTSIISRPNIRHTSFEPISSSQARDILGTYGSCVKGVTWLVPDSDPYNTTLLSLWRTYSALDTNINSTGHTTLAPPRRLIYPNNRFFTDANPPYEEHWIPRVRTNTGFHPFLAKALFPDMTILYYEDWEDWQRMEVPVLFERVVVADRVAALDGVFASGDGGKMPPHSAAFKLNASMMWWEPVRRSLVEWFDAYEQSPVGKSITYLHRQGRRTGPQLTAETHTHLVQALEALVSEEGYQLQIVSSYDDETDWSSRMEAIVKSQLVIGIAHDDLFDAIFMQLSPRNINIALSSAAIIEIFPQDTFSLDREVVFTAMGLQYYAWKNDELFGPGPGNLPPVYVPSRSDIDSAVVEGIDVDVDALVETVRQVFIANR